MDTDSDRGKPVGRDQVVSAVLEHAADLFAERGPAATSIRDIAIRSGVNQGLIFRHLGVKEQLIGAVLDYLGAEAETLIHTGASRGAFEKHAERHWKVIARTILDGYPIAQLQQRFPLVAHAVEHARRHRPDDEARLAAAHATALQLGWRLFEPFLRSATELSDLPEENLQAAVDALTYQLLAETDSGKDVSRQPTNPLGFPPGTKY
ncbi:TetR/AcrR family transcriptional regulator [Nocardia sp. 004]|uniref:TetR/AcrR family transcriptional regulator n=1 Tax=Nocardia sp. 004 TaxID=3385978 RepID=UPI0039A0958D